MPDFFKDTNALSIEAMEFEQRASADAADRAVAEDLSTVRAKHTEGGMLLIEENRLRQYEQAFRANYDKALRERADQLETKRTQLDTQIAEAMREAEELPTFAAKYKTSPDRYLQASILEELQRQRVRAELQGLTRTQLLERYARLRDDSDDDNPTIRLIEAAVRSQELDRLGVMDDPTHDAIALTRLTDAVAARRRQRIPDEWFTAKRNLERLYTLGASNVIHMLRSGRGVAARPRVVA